MLRAHPIACAALLATVAPLAACGPQFAPTDGGPADLTTAPDLALRDAVDLAPVDLAPPDAAADLARPDLGLGTPKGKVQLTYYWIAYEGDYTGAKDTILCDAAARTIATVPLAFANAIALEGTGRLVDGRLLNVGASCACPSGSTICYIVLDQTRYPWGMGAGNRALAPYRSIAVDRTFIPLGSKVYVPELEGVKMPAAYGFVHDGCVRADDVGGGIKGAHIDFFVAERSSYLALDKLLRLSSVTAYQSPPRCP